MERRIRASPATTAVPTAQTTAQRWEVRGQSSYDFTPKAYWFGAGRYDDDRFSAYDYQGSLATGLGYRFVDTDKTKFWVQGGPGYRVSKERETGDTVDGLIFRGDLGFEQQLTENTKIVERFLIETRLRQHLPAEQPRARGHDVRARSGCGSVTRCGTTPTSRRASRRPTR